MPEIIYKNKYNIFPTDLHRIIFENIITDTYNDRGNINFIVKINEQKDKIIKLCFNKYINFDVSVRNFNDNLFVEVMFG